MYMTLLLISLIFHRTSLIIKQYYSWGPLTGQFSPSSKILWPFNITEEDQACLVKLWGSNLSQLLFKIHFKRVVLELLALICKREISSIHSHGFFPPEAFFPALGGGVERLSTEAFFPWSGSVCLLLTQAPYSSLLVLPPKLVEMHQG